MDELRVTIESLQASMTTVHAVARKSRGSSDLKRAALSIGILLGAELLPGEPA
jgi:hypothetical protein